jgi:hypothetical protein
VSNQSEAFPSSTAKHLDLIASTIARLAHHSFLLKGWSTTLTAALVALALREDSTRLLAVPLVPAVVFWLLDGFYLAQERRFRRLHKTVVADLTKASDLQMDCPEPKCFREQWCGGVLSFTVALFHLSVIGALVFALLWSKSHV